jgi:hypothetical protein
LIWKVESLYNSVRMMDYRHCKDVEQRLKFFDLDYKTIFQTKKPVTITAEDKTEVFFCLYVNSKDFSLIK